MNADTSIFYVGSQRLRVAMWHGQAEDDRPPLLICNGIGANVETLDPFVAQYGSRPRIIAFDAPGVGESSTPTIPYRFKGLAKVLAGLIKQLELDKVDMLGLSWGGGLAQQFARSYPNLCRRLVLAATSPGSVMVPGDLKALVRLMHPKRYADPSFMTNIAGDIYGGMFRDDPTHARRHARLISPPKGKGYLWQLWAIQGWSSLPWLRKIEQPTLIMAGTDDPIVPDVNARLMHRMMKDSRLALFDCGHLFMLTLAKLSAQVVNGFLRGEMISDVEVRTASDGSYVISSVVPDSAEVEAS